MKKKGERKEKKRKGCGQNKLSSALLRSAVIDYKNARQFLSQPETKLNQTCVFFVF